MLEAELSGNPFAHFLLARQAREAETEVGLIVGYLCYWIVFEEIRLMNLAVIESMRHRGIARSLVLTALQLGLSQSAHRAVLEVRASNEAGKSLYLNLGFRHTAVRKKYYNNPVEDALLMELDPIVLDSEVGGVAHRHKGGQGNQLRS